MLAASRGLEGVESGPALPLDLGVAKLAAQSIRAEAILPKAIALFTLGV